MDSLLTRRGDRVTIELDEAQQAALSGTFVQLREMLVDGTDQHLKRLFPAAYPEHPELDAEYRRLVGDDLLARKLDAIDVVEAALTSGELKDDEAFFAWMGSLNDLRLVLGSKLEVDGSDDDGPNEGQDEMAWAIYQFLGYLLECTVEIAPL
ncbi:MAG: DUF2017 family protein [Acidobacteria bacterium]|nr:DUF2017 family protein [Acidobacteriota bacterium]